MSTLLQLGNYVIWTCDGVTRPYKLLIGPELYQSKRTPNHVRQIDSPVTGKELIFLHNKVHTFCAEKRQQDFVANNPLSFTFRYLCVSVNMGFYIFWLHTVKTQCNWAGCWLYFEIYNRNLYMYVQLVKPSPDAPMSGNPNCGVSGCSAAEQQASRPLRSLVSNFHSANFTVNAPVKCRRNISVCSSCRSSSTVP